MTTVSGSGAVLNITSGQTSSGVIVLNAGVVNVSHGGTTVATTATSADEFVSAGGTASTTLVSNGGLLGISGGTAINTIVSSGGHLDVYSVLFGTGTVRSTTVFFGGFENIDGGTVTATTLSGAGAQEVVLAGGTLSNLTLSGGSATISSGGSLVGATISAGGVLEIASSAIVGATPITISSGTLKLDNSQAFTGSVTGLANANQAVDFTDINFATFQTVAYSGTTLSGQLTVSDGTHVARLNLIGNYLGATFTSASDGHGGTLVTDPPMPPGESSPMPTAHSSA
jgi:autotransporter passenger strand-loop-strand repeat protein